MSLKSSIYFYFFNVNKMGYDYKSVISNFCAFADEVVCATIKCEDGTRESLAEMEKEFPNFKVVETDIQLSDNRFDGKLKTAALKATTNPIKIIADGDEKFLLWQKPLWEKHYEVLMMSKQECVDGLMVPVLDLWGSPERIRVDKNIGLKFRIHLDTIKSRGVIPEAELYDGYFNTKLSDSTEALNEQGQLGRFVSIASPHYLHPLFSRNLIETPYVVHFGYLDLKHRAEKVAVFWKPHWEARSGQEEDVDTNEDSLKQYPTIDHGLPITDEAPPEQPKDNSNGW